MLRDVLMGITRPGTDIPPPAVLGGRGAYLWGRKEGRSPDAPPSHALRKMARTGSAVETDRSSMEPTTRRLLSNGLIVLLREVHAAPVATFWAWYRVGSRNEVPGITGISHWVEHMLFKGTPTLGKGEFSRLVNRHGGSWNGFTWKDFTAYFETLPAEHIGLGIQIESDRMTHSLFDPEEVESERTVIISEREGAENNPEYALYEEVEAAAYRVHTYRHAVIGYKSDLLAMTRDDLIRHYRTYYTPNNAVVVAVGDFDSQALLARVREAFESIPAGPKPPAVRSVEPPQEGERRVMVRRPVGAAVLAELRRLCEEPVGAEELDKVRKQARAQWVYAADGVSGQAVLLGSSEIVADCDYLARFLDRVTAVTPEAIRRAAANVFAEANRTVGWYIPEPARVPEAEAEAMVHA